MIAQPRNSDLVTSIYVATIGLVTLSLTCGSMAVRQWNVNHWIVLDTRITSLTSKEINLGHHGGRRVHWLAKVVSIVCRDDLFRMNEYLQYMYILTSCLKRQPAETMLTNISQPPVWCFAWHLFKLLRHHPRHLTQLAHHLYPFIPVEHANRRFANGMLFLISGNNHLLVLSCSLSLSLSLTSTLPSTPHLDPCIILSLLSLSPSPSLPTLHRSPSTFPCSFFHFYLCPSSFTPSHSLSHPHPLPLSPCPILIHTLTPSLSHSHPLFLSPHRLPPILPSSAHTGPSASNEGEMRLHEWGEQFV